MTEPGQTYLVQKMIFRSKKKRLEPLSQVEIEINIEHLILIDEICLHSPGIEIVVFCSMSTTRRKKRVIEYDFEGKSIRCWVHFKHHHQHHHLFPVFFLNKTGKEKKLNVLKQTK